jgi:hypothetical protein
LIVRSIPPFDGGQDLSGQNRCAISGERERHLELPRRSFQFALRSTGCQPDEILFRRNKLSARPAGLVKQRGCVVVGKGVVVGEDTP